MNPDDLVTVVIPTSPVETNPSTAHIDETLASARERLPLAEVVLVADGVRPEQERLAGAYTEYLRLVTWKCHHEWRNVVPVLMGPWGHQANAVRRALENVTTPLILFMEHDTPLVGPIDFPAICAFIMSGEANAVRFHFDVAIHPDHEDGMLDHETRIMTPGNPPGTFEMYPESRVPVRRTMTWWQRPHLASTRFYRERVMPRFTEGSRTMIEDLMHGVVSTDRVTLGDAAWWDWRLWVYTPDGPPDRSELGMKRSSHLDARGSEPKFDMRYR